MRILITCDRSWYGPAMAESVVGRLIARHGAGFVVVHGGAAEIDRSFAEACAEKVIPQEVHPARWEELEAHRALPKPVAIDADSRNAAPACVVDAGPGRPHLARSG